MEVFDTEEETDKFVDEICKVDDDIVEPEYPVKDVPVTVWFAEVIDWNKVELCKIVV